MKLLLLALLLSGCSPTTAVDTTVDAAAATVAVAVAQASAPPIFAAKDVAAGVVEAIPSASAPLPVAMPETEQEAAIATALITRWEIGSEAQYRRLYAGITCPGGASGPTVGIGYDLGQQSARQIRKDWAGHPQVGALAQGSGVIGDRACRAFRASHRDVRVSIEDAQRVFQMASLPIYARAAGRALKRGWTDVSGHYRAGMVSLGYNRGWVMAGERRREMRTLRDDCVPQASVPCGQAALVSMCRLWAGTRNGNGLCARRKDEARVIGR